MQDEPWNGVSGSYCEHRTVGYRAWCHQCQEWCYPDSPCLRCTKPDERIAELEAALAGHSERLAVLAGEIANQRAVERDLKTENAALREALKSIAHELTVAGPYRGRLNRIMNWAIDALTGESTPENDVE